MYFLDSLDCYKHVVGRQSVLSAHCSEDLHAFWLDTGVQRNLIKSVLYALFKQTIRKHILYIAVYNKTSGVS